MNTHQTSGFPGTPSEITLKKQISVRKFTYSLFFVLIMGRGVFAHDPKAQEAVANQPDYAERVARMRAMEPEKLDIGLQTQALYEMRKAHLAASGLSPQAIANVLYGGAQFDFPYSANPELRAYDDVKTLTILIDFKDQRAHVVMPGLGTSSIQSNIYDEGTDYAKTMKPYDSVNAYYKRASQGKVNVKGTVLDWYHLPQNRETYHPSTAGMNPTQKATSDNLAIFRMMKQALDAADAAGHDFTQYDNDHDGDIDLVTILYAGPDTGWGSFWWAYRWQFFAPEAINATFDGKNVRQFVFQFIKTRNGGKDYDPETLLHEMGHSFGLADYYDYDKYQGPEGGVGQLDMMDANWGNHNAFSRWLLNWIRPDIISEGAPTERTLVASGSQKPDNKNKAIAIFPKLSNADSPGQEMFIVENREPIGNDGGNANWPGRGLLIWHVVGKPNDNDNGFQLNNSFTDTKLIRLLRADSPGDFKATEHADASTFFGQGKEFTPTSLTNSNDYSGKATGISLTNISAPGEEMKLTIGFVGASPSTPQNAAPVAEAASGTLNIHALEQVGEDAVKATPETLGQQVRDTLKTKWDELTAQDKVVLEIRVRQWAAKDGAKAVAALKDAKLVQASSSLLSSALASWAVAAPGAASAWYDTSEAKAFLEETKAKLGTRFAHEVFAWRSKNDFPAALAGASSLKDPQAVVNAVQGIEASAEKLGISAKEIYSAAAADLKPEFNKALQKMLLNRVAGTVRSDVEGAKEAIKNYEILKNADKK